jgi:hypothetical protein
LFAEQIHAPQSNEMKDMTAPHLNEDKGQRESSELRVSGSVALMQLLHGLPPIPIHQRSVRHLLLSQLLQAGILQLVTSASLWSSIWFA